MKITTDLNEANDLLQKYSGCKVQIYMYSISLRRLMLKLVSPKIKETLYIVGIGCEYISGKIEWSNAELSINVSKENIEDFSTEILDRKNEFVLKTTGGFSIAQGMENEFGTTFDNFISSMNS